MKLKQLIAGVSVLSFLLAQSIMAEEIGYAKCNEEYINIRSEASTESEILGKIYNNGQVIIESQTDDGWYKIRSGNVSGYIKSDFVAVGAEAESAADEAAYNVAYVYPEVLIVRAEPSEDSREIDRVYEGQEVEVVDTEGDWAKVCLAPDSYGYISAYYIDYNTYYGTAESLEEEQARLDQEWLDYLAEQEAIAAAEEAAYIEYLNSLNYYYEVEATDNDDYYYEEDSTQDYYYEEDSDYEEEVYEESQPTLQPEQTSTPEPTPTPTVSSSNSGGGQYLSDYAKQFIGNPYVWGGSSLQTGADCSGFTMAVLGANGITVADQAAGGTKVSLSEAQAGDLIYYQNGSGIYHIAIYNGDGTVTHSSSSTTGVTVSDINYSGNAAGAVRYW